MLRGRNGCSQEERVVGQKITTRSQLTALLHLMFAQHRVSSSCSHRLDALIEVARQLQIPVLKTAAMATEVSQNEATPEATSHGLAPNGDTPQKDTTMLDAPIDQAAVCPPACPTLR
jgi:hypothetical protein